MEPGSAQDACTSGLLKVGPAASFRVGKYLACLQIHKIHLNTHRKISL